MLFRERLVRDTASAEPRLERTDVDNKVLSAVAGQYSQMDREHARIRKEALAVVSSQEATVEPLNNRDLSLPSEP